MSSSPDAPSTASAPIRVGIVAGEASGDLLGAHLIGALKAQLPLCRVFGVGGPKMQAAGLELWHPAEALAVRGYAEVVRHLPRILGIRGDVRRRLLSDPPDLFIGVDAPDFNLGLEESLKREQISTVHYVSPSLWAWRPQRIHKIKRAADKVLCLFPFEPAIYTEAGIAAAYVGHPLADMLPLAPERAAAREQFRLRSAQTVIALLPGSRQSELDYMADLFVQTAKLLHRHIKSAHFLVPLISRETRRQFEDALYRNQAEALPITMLFGHAHLALTAADGALLASGTAALEAALLKCPMVVTYRLSGMSYAIGRSKIKLPYVALPNILANRFLVPEIFQDEATPEVLSQALVNVVFDKEVRTRLGREFLALHERLRQNSAERLIAELMPLFTRSAPPVLPPALDASGQAVGT